MAAAAKKTPARKWPASKVELRDLLSLRPNPRNARAHSADQVAAIRASLRRFGFTIPLLIDETDLILAGHGRWEGAKGEALDGDERFEQVPVIVARGWSEADKRAYAIADNQLALASSWDDAMLLEELQALKLDSEDLGLLGFTPDQLTDLFAPADPGAGAPAAGKVSLRDRFGLPPFSILDARQGWWQDRKRAWLALGIQSEVGRGGNLLKMSDTILEPDAKKRAKAKAFGTNGTIRKPDGAMYEQTGTSIFDPVLAEMAIRWFAPVKGLVFDPFAGGSVRGIVASRLGRRYVGIDLRAEQIEANRAQAAAIGKTPKPTWVEGDSSEMDKILTGSKLGGLQADMVLSCPPYADLERYSDDPRDISTMKPADFFQAYRKIIALTVKRMAPDSFAVWVVSEVRGKAKGGAYIGLVPETIEAFEAAGAGFYNEAILVNSAGSLAIRARRAFEASRKLGRTHQNVLIFCKGDPEKATVKIGEVEFDATAFEQPAGDPKPAAAFGEPL